MPSPKSVDELLEVLARNSAPRSHYVSHQSSNLDSLAAGFQERPYGISFARAPHERMSSPTGLEPEGRRGIVYAKVDGRGVDYSRPEIRALLDELNAAAIDAGGSADAVIPALRNSGVDWVNNWNSIGAADELHVLQPAAVQVRRVFELPRDRGYQFPRPPESLPSRMYADPAVPPEWLSAPIRTVRARP